MNVLTSKKWEGVKERGEGSYTTMITETKLIIINRSCFVVVLTYLKVVTI